MLGLQDAGSQSNPLHFLSPASTCNCGVRDCNPAREREMSDKGYMQRVNLKSGCGPRMDTSERPLVFSLSASVRTPHVGSR